MASKSLLKEKPALHEKTRAGQKQKKDYPIQGAHPQPGGVLFRLWAPNCGGVNVKMIRPGGDFSLFPMERAEADGDLFETFVPGAGLGTRYLYILDGKLERPDPASRYQPEGVHGPSEVTDPMGYEWGDAGWKSPPLREYIIYELHVGTFTPEGTFLAAAEKAPYLKELGITAVELMPVAQFPGERNWGYDGAYPYAPQNSYGGPDGLKQLIDSLHRAGIAVVLDVVYNHFGPEGSYFADYGPYFTGNYKTPWGAAINYDGPLSGPVREFFLQNALYWGREFHMDALRLDAVHGIFDESPTHIIEELRRRMDALENLTGRPFYLFIESDRNDTRFIRPPLMGGYGADAHWNEDFHHALHVLLTGEQTGYYMDFSGQPDLLKSFEEGFVYTGQYSGYRKKYHGSLSWDIPADKFVAFSQNHDQVGNRLLGGRLGSLLPPEKLMLGAALVLLGPYIPLLFMGEEYGEKAPFMYFVSHGGRALVKAVREGRRKEFSAFRWEGDVPDPQSVETFLISKINPEVRKKKDPGVHSELFNFYKKLISLRKEVQALSAPERRSISASLQGNVLTVTRRSEGGYVFAGFNLSGSQAVAFPPGPVVQPGQAPGLWSALLGPTPGNDGRVSLGPYETVLLRTEKEKGKEKDIKTGNNI